MRLLLFILCCLFASVGCTSAKYSLSYADEAKLAGADLKRIAIVSNGGNKSGFLQSFTQYVAANFNYHGYKCTGIYYDSASFETTESVAKRVAALQPDLTVALNIVTDTLERANYGKSGRGNIYHMDVWRGSGAGKKQVAHGTATVNNDSDVSGADYKRIANKLCLELLRNCIAYPTVKGQDNAGDSIRIHSSRPDSPSR